MNKFIQARITKSNEYFVAECLNLSLVTQGKTLDDLVKNLEEAVTLHLEGENLADYDLIEKPSILAIFEFEPVLHAQT